MAGEGRGAGHRESGAGAGLGWHWRRVCGGGQAHAIAVRGAVPGPAAERSGGMAAPLPGWRRCRTAAWAAWGRPLTGFGDVGAMQAQHQTPGVHAPI